MDEVLDIARGLNRNLEALVTGQPAGAPVRGEHLERVRAETLEQARRLDAVRGSAGPGAQEHVRKVADHLALTLEALAAAGAAPGLTSRLLVHLLDEQWEIVGALERRRGDASPRPSEANPPTVGSLIGR